MDETKTVDRPLSPHLTIYRPQINSITSIFTRITGIGLLVGAVFIVWWLLALASGPEAFAGIDGFLTGWFGGLIMIGVLWAAWYHFLAGLRHLYYDAGLGLEIEESVRLGWLVVGGSVVLTVLTLFLI